MPSVIIILCFFDFRDMMMVMMGNMMTRVMRAMMTTTATSRKGTRLFLKDILSQHELINA